MRADGSVGMIFPNYMGDNLRTTLFVDAGNVYTSLNNRGFGGQSTTSGPIRYSVGLEADCLTPFGPIELSLATPIARRPHDKSDVFQFAMGANF
jgi:outer membrane protein insertion porin family